MIRIGDLDDILAALSNPVVPVLPDVTFVGAYDGGSHYYAGREYGGWLTKEVFESIYRKSPAKVAGTILGRLHVGDVSAFSEQMPRPYGDRTTFLGFVELPESFVQRGVSYFAHAVFVNAQNPELPMMDATGIDRGVVKRKAVFRRIAGYFAHGRLPSSEEIVGMCSAGILTASIGVPRTMAPSVDAADVDADLETFVGAWDGCQHYYCGVREGWVFADAFEACHGVSPVAYCNRHYAAFASCDRWEYTSLAMFPNPFPKQCTFLGVMPCDGGGRTVHINVVATFGDAEAVGHRVAVDVKDATRSSPGARDRCPLLSSHVACVDPFEKLGLSKCGCPSLFPAVLGKVVKYGMGAAVDTGRSVAS